MFKYHVTYTAIFKKKNMNKLQEEEEDLIQ